jgi:nucleoid DNA-binding protein
MVKILPVFLKLGQTIKLDRFGSFRISVKSNGKENAADLTAKNVKSTKLVFLPSVELKRNLGNISFKIG